MAFRPDVRPGRDPHPSDVPGYERARALGLLPSTPADPPTPVVTSSTRATRRFIGFILAMFVSMPLAEGLGLTFMVPGGLAFIGIVIGMQVSERLRRREFEAGYTRVVRLISNDLTDWRHLHHSRPVAWDMDGLWLLDDDDRPVRRPVDGVLPPGHYPSPDRPGQLRYWTGAAWLFGYRQPAAPFLDTPS